MSAKFVLVMQNKNHLMLISLFITTLSVLISTLIDNEWMDYVSLGTVLISAVIYTAETISRNKYSNQFFNQYYSEFGIKNNNKRTPEEALGQLINVKDKYLENINNITNDQHLEHDEEEDVINASLVNLDTKLKRIDAKEKLRRWHNEGLKKFNDLFIQNNNTLQDLCEKALSDLINYLQINQGAIFLVEKNDDAYRGVQFRAISTYAYGRRKYGENLIEGAQGLIGQCYLETDAIYLTDIPKEYVKITSGLGEATPTAVFIIPLISEEEVVAVLELGSVQEVEEHKKEFIQVLSESLASNIHSIIRVKRTNDLLAESKKKSQLLEETEENLKQNVDELKVIHSDLELKQKELETLKNESVERFELINKGSRTALWDIRVDLQKALSEQEIWWSDKSLEILGLIRLPHSIAELKNVIHPKDIDRFASDWMKLIKGKAVNNSMVIDLRLMQSEDEVVWFQVSASVQMSDNKAKRIAGSLLNINELKKANEKIKQLEQKQEMTLGSVTMGSVVFDNDLKLTYANSFAEEVLGESCDALIGKQLHEIVQLGDDFRNEEESFSYSWTESADYLLGSKIRLNGSHAEKVEVSIEEINLQDGKEYILFIKGRGPNGSDVKNKDRVFDHLRFINSKLDKIRNFADQDLLGLTDSLAQNIKSLNNVKATLTDDLEIKLVNNINSGFNSLIVDLQYHDALTQKLDHIKEVQDRIYKDVDYYQIMDEIIHLLICQMGTIRIEYEELSDSIQQSLFEIMTNKDIVEKAGIMYNDSFEHTYQIFKAIDQIVRHYRVINTFTQDGKIRTNLKEKMLNEIYENYSMESERKVFAKIFGREEEEADNDIELF